MDWYDVLSISHPKNMKIPRKHHENWPQNDD